MYSVRLKTFLLLEVTLRQKLICLLFWNNDQLFGDILVM